MLDAGDSSPARVFKRGTVQLALLILLNYKTRSFRCLTTEHSTQCRNILHSTKCTAVNCRFNGEAGERGGRKSVPTDAFVCAALLLRTLYASSSAVITTIILVSSSTCACSRENRKKKREEKKRKGKRSGEEVEKGRDEVVEGGREAVQVVVVTRYYGCGCGWRCGGRRLRW